MNMKAAFKSPLGHKGGGQHDPKASNRNYKLQLDWFQVGSDLASGAADKDRIAMTIIATLNYGHLGELSHSDLALLEETNKEVAQYGINENQCVKQFIISRIDGTSGFCVIYYELILEELCIDTREEKIKSKTMYNVITSYMTAEINNGKFASLLQSNDLVCGLECAQFGNASVEDGMFDNVVVVVIKSNTSSSPWVIHFIGLAASFNLNSDEKLIANDDIGRYHQYKALLFERDCIKNITDVAVNSTESKTSQNITFDVLTLGHSFDKTDIASSNIWNATSS